MLKDKWVFCSNDIYCVKSQLFPSLLKEGEMPPQPLGVPESIAWVMGWKYPKGQWVCPDCLKRDKNESR